MYIIPDHGKRLSKVVCRPFPRRIFTSLGMSLLGGPKIQLSQAGFEPTRSDAQPSASATAQLVPYRSGTPACTRTGPGHRQ